MESLVGYSFIMKGKVGVCRRSSSFSFWRKHQACIISSSSTWVGEFSRAYVVTLVWSWSSSDSQEVVTWTEEQ